MHVVLGLLGALVTAFYLLDRLGIDIGGLNPFYWYRRRAFAKKLSADPIYSIEDPIHVAALLIIGVAKIDGDLTAEQRRVAQEQFESNFSMDSHRASELFGSAAHLLAAPQLLDTQLISLASQNNGRFTKDQAESMIQMMVNVASADGDPTESQRTFIKEIESQFVPTKKVDGTWV